jgi:hypothetical protein
VSEVSSDQEWLERLATFKAVPDLAKKRMCSSAMTMIEEYLSRNPPSDLRCDALSCKASLLEDQGDLGAARESLLAALPLTTGGYQRYTIELSLGCLEEEVSMPEEAVKWYLKALETAEEDGSILPKGRR